MAGSEQRVVAVIMVGGPTKGEQICCARPHISSVDSPL
jgi:hypothetical protein